MVFNITKKTDATLIVHLNVILTLKGLAYKFCALNLTMMSDVDSKFRQIGTEHRWSTIKPFK